MSSAPSIANTVLKFFSLTLLCLSISIYANAETSEKVSSERPKDLEVKITEEIPFLEVLHNGKVVRIQRIQDLSFKITNSFARTSRKCPPFCVRPIKLPDGVETVGEIELLHFLMNEVRNNTGILVDARLTAWHVKGTIPGSVSIPFTMFTRGVEDIDTLKLLGLLGVKEKDNGDLIFDDAMNLLLFCNGPWCGQSPKAIKHLLKMGYPAKKLLWYRGGMQAWQSFGLTTIQPESDLSK